MLEIHGKEYKMTALPLRTVRPFVMDDCALEEAAETENLDTSDRMEIEKYLKKRVRKESSYKL